MATLASPLAVRLADPTIQTWVELRYATRPLTLSEIADGVRRRCATTLREILAAIDAWVSRGLVAATGRPVAYAMAATAKADPNPPIQSVDAAPRYHPKRAPRERLWSAMRVLKRFDLVTITMAADVSESRAKDFLRTMTRAGYLRSVVLPTGQGLTTWVSGGRTWGPLPPQITRMMVDGRSIERVTDRNDGTIVDIPLRMHRPDRVGLIAGDGSESALEARGEG